MSSIGCDRSASKFGPAVYDRRPLVRRSPDRDDDAAPAGIDDGADDPGPGIVETASFRVLRCEVASISRGLVYRGACVFERTLALPSEIAGRDRGGSLEMTAQSIEFERVIEMIREKASGSTSGVLRASWASLRRRRCGAPSRRAGEPDSRLHRETDRAARLPADRRVVESDRAASRPATPCGVAARVARRAAVPRRHAPRRRLEQARRQVPSMGGC